jgi:chromosome segregation ATPase
VETKLAAFRMQNNGRLPDQVESNMRQLAAASASITYLDTAISRANQDKLTLEGNLRILKDRLAAQKKEPVEAMAMAAAAGQKSERLAEAERHVELLDITLMQKRQQYKDAHPDVQTVLAQLEGAKRKRDEIAKEESAKENAKKDQPAVVRPITLVAAREQRDIEENIRKLEIQIQGVDTQIEDYTKQLKRANEVMRSYQARIETVPLGEKQYGELLRDREVANQKYLELETKLARAQMSKQMEDRKQGELLEILDPATLPRDQTEPKRPLIISVGAALGLLLGVAIAGAREVKDTSLKNLKDVRAYTQMAILGSIPLLENDFVVRRRKRLAWLGWTTACLAATVVMAGSIVYYYATKV